MHSYISPADVGVAIATFNRNDGLSELLDSLQSQQNASGFSVTIVDNSPDGQARRVSNNPLYRAGYIHEPRPGIVAARNAALAAMRDKKAIIFIDDDEFVDAKWFETLLQTLNSWDADVVFGPVIPLFAEDCPRWVKTGGFFDRPRHATGTLVPVGATNNTIMRTEALYSLSEPKFDEEFSISGGSDTELFQRFSEAGSRMVWCDEALVYERVPATRTTLSWVWKRAVRVGNVNARLQLRKHGQPRVVAMGALRIVFGLIKVAARVFTWKTPRSPEIGTLARGVGYIQAALGKNSREYARN